MNSNILFCIIGDEFSFAAYAFKCEVKKVETGKMTVKCKRSDLKKNALKTGDKLQIKKIIEGC